MTSGDFNQSVRDTQLPQQSTELSSEHPATAGCVCVCGNPVSKGVHVSSYVHIPAGGREGRAAIPANEDSPLYP